MRYRTATLACIVIALFIGACGGGTSQGANDNTEARSVTDEELAAALLNLDEMPTGWTPAPSQIPIVGFCDQILIPLADDVGVSANYQGSSNGPYFDQRIQAFSDDLAAEEMDYLKRYASSCSEWIQNFDDGTSAVVSVSPLSFPEFGDEMLAHRLTYKQGRNVYEEDLVIVRVKNLKTSLQYGSGDRNDDDSARFEDLVRLAIDKLTDLAGS